MLQLLKTQAKVPCAAFHLLIKVKWVSANICPGSLRVGQLFSFLLSGPPNTQANRTKMTRTNGCQSGCNRIEELPSCPSRNTRKISVRKGPSSFTEVPAATITQLFFG